MDGATVAGVGHPLVDHAGTGPDGTAWVATESWAPVVHLNPLRVNLLAQAAAEGVRVALVTGEHSCLTRGLAHVWRRAGGAWVVRDPNGGLHDGFSSRALGTIADAWTGATAGSPDDTAPRHPRPQGTGALHLTVIVAERHPARESVLLGGTMEALGDTLGAQPREWGAHEPVGETWDRRALTLSVRDRMPAETTVLVTGERLAATVGAARTAPGVEEVTHVSVALPASTGSELAATRVRLDATLGRLTQQAMPLVALVLARPGRRDLLVPPFATEPPVPLTLLVGAPAVRTLELDPTELADRLGGQLVGRPRLPALLFPLGAYGPEAWLRLDEIADALDPWRLDEAMGPTARLLWADRPEVARAP